MNTIQNFWNQFEKINLTLYLMEDITQDLKLKNLRILSKALAAYHKDLGFLIKNSTPHAELTISAHGNPYLFKDVELLVNFAPTLERWKIRAFIQPDTNLQLYKDAKDLPLKYHGISLKVSDSYFEIYDDKSQFNALGIQVLLKNYIIIKDHPKFREAVDTFVEHLIGEKAFANQLAFIDIAQLTSENIVNGIPLYQLYEHLSKNPQKCNN